MKLIIQTQHRENYGAHDWDGKGECPEIWKNKHGDTYVMRDLTEEQIKKMWTEIFPNLQFLIEFFNISFEEFIVGRSIVDDDAPECEEWDQPWVISEECGEYVARRYTPAQDWWTRGFTGKTESYIMAEAGERINYLCEYHEEKA